MSSHVAPPRRMLAGLPALALVAGSMLGIGIFISPHVVAGLVDDEAVFLGMWVAGGLTALFGALCLAELGAMMPRSGGDYTYLRLGWGRGVAFAAGWLQLLAIFPGSLASVALATSTYQLPVLFGSSVEGVFVVGALALPKTHVFAALIIVVLTLVNHIGVKLSGWVQLVFTSIPLVVLLLAGVAVLFMPAIATPAAVPPIVEGEGSVAGNLARAYLPVYFAYSGWNAAIYVGGEVKNPKRNLPLALVGGTLLVTLLYLALCFGFLEIFGLAGLAEVGEAGTAAAQAMFGRVGITVVTAMILLTMIGSLNGTVLTGSRIGYAMARKGDCFADAGVLHGRFGTPTAALWMQAAIAIALLVLGSHLAELISYTSSAMLITGTLTVLTVIVLRRRMAERSRPYRAWLYPLSPLLYAASSLTVLIVLFIDGDVSVWFTLIWFGGALGFFVLRQQWSRGRLARGSAGLTGSAGGATEQS